MWLTSLSIALVRLSIDNDRRDLNWFLRSPVHWLGGILSILHLFRILLRLLAPLSMCRLLVLIRRSSRRIRLCHSQVGIVVSFAMDDDEPLAGTPEPCLLKPRQINLREGNLVD